MSSGRRTIGKHLATMALGLLLSGCDNALITIDLGTDPPADPAIDAVEANLLGLEFRKDDGTTPTLEFRQGEPVDLLDLDSGDPLRLFTDEELPPGTYTGVRLLFDGNQDDSRVTRGNDVFRLRPGDGSFAGVNFKVVDEERSEDQFTLVLDLRQSLSFEDDRDRYQLTPVLRTVESAEAARIEGDVTAGCPSGTVVPTDGAVYLYPGRDVAPDDIDGVGTEPFATTRVTGSSATTFRYALRYLPAGDYTLAYACNGIDDVPGVDDELDFRSVANVTVDAGEALQRDLN